MATNQEIQVFQNDDPTVSIEVTDSAGAPYDLTGLRVEILIKASRDTPDTSQLYLLSTSTGEITILDAPNGLASASFADTLATSGNFWYHAYVSDASGSYDNRHTFAYGQLRIQAV